VWENELVLDVMMVMLVDVKIKASSEKSGRAYFL
jgi:hypothetical protein